MPRELKSLEEIDDRLLANTEVVYRKGTADGIKYKLRTKKILYTLKVSSELGPDVESRIESSARPIEIIDV